MITLLNSGLYQLSETKHHHKVLKLGRESFAWINITGVGDVLVATHAKYKVYEVLSYGDYRLYSVEDEPNLSDHTHLELETGKQLWQGYLLLTGLPLGEKKRGRIIPTKEVIADNPAYEKQNTEDTVSTMFGNYKPSGTGG